LFPKAPVFVLALFRALLTFSLMVAESVNRPLTESRLVRSTTIVADDVFAGDVKLPVSERLTVQFPDFRPQFPVIRRSQSPK
jgi:hypothetical protein